MDEQTAARDTPAGFAAVPVAGDTVLTGRLSDQSALQGVLAQIEALGLELVEVRRR